MDMLVYITCGTKLILAQSRHEVENPTIYNISINCVINVVLFLHVVGDGRLGYPDLAPYDAIHVGAAPPTLPPAVSTLIY